MGGIRVREGSGHFIYNNYFEGLNRRTIYLQNDPSDPLSDIHIYHNTIINSEELRLGGIGNNSPSNVIIANNVFSNPKSNLFDEATGNEMWINNFSFGALGISRPSTGLLDIDPVLNKNSMGFYQPEENSSVISGASDAYPEIPLYPEMDYDNELRFDLMKELRPILKADQAVGASEFSPTVNVQPHVTESNTGPSYLYDDLINYVAASERQFYIDKEGENRSITVSSNTAWTVMTSSDWISIDLTAGTGDAQLNVTIDANDDNISRSGSITITGGAQSVTINVFQDPGDVVSVIENLESEVRIFPNPTEGRLILSNLPPGVHRSQIQVLDLFGEVLISKMYRITNNELEIDLDNVLSGTYLLNVKFINHNGIHAEVKP